jgi:hypothetical protein
MNRIGILILLFLMPIVSLPSALGHPSMSWHGVRFHYRAHKLAASILKASLSIERDGPLYVVKATVDSVGVVRPVFRMNNRFTSYIKEDGFEPWRYIKEVDQNGIFSKRKRYTDILTFDPTISKVKVERVAPHGVQEVSVPPQTYDPLSVFLKLFLGSDGHNGQTIKMKIYDGIKLKEVTFYAACGQLSIPLYGSVKAMCLESKVPFSSLGDREGVIKIWYTDDERRFPVAMSLKLPSVGNVEFELTKVETW